jgi:hypothetical protein
MNPSGARDRPHSRCLEVNRSIDFTRRIRHALDQGAARLDPRLAHRLRLARLSAVAGDRSDNAPPPDAGADNTSAECSDVTRNDGK